VRVVIAGSRKLCKTIYEIGEVVKRTGWEISEVVSGKCGGVDRAGEVWAKSEKIPVKPFPANWDKYGKAAGPIRNQAMAEYADAVIVIWDGVSPGSSNMIKATKLADKLLYTELP